MCTSPSGSRALMLLLHCESRCDVDVVLSSLEVVSVYDVPFLSACGDSGDDVASAALLPCKSECGRDRSGCERADVSIIPFDDVFSLSSMSSCVVAIMMSL